MSEQNSAIAELIDAAIGVTGWSEDEVRAFLRCIRADTPDGLLSDTASAVEWAARVEAQAAVVELMKCLPKGTLQAKWTGTEIALRIDPKVDVHVVEPDEEMQS